MNLVIATLILLIQLLVIAEFGDGTDAMLIACTKQLLLFIQLAVVLFG